MLQVCAPEIFHITIIYTPPHSNTNKINGFNMKILEIFREKLRYKNYSNGKAKQRRNFK